MRRHKAYDFAEANWSSDVMILLLETQDDIATILTQVSDLGFYSVDEWVNFFTGLRNNIIKLN